MTYMLKMVKDVAVLNPKLLCVLQRREVSLESKLTRC